MPETHDEQPEESGEPANTPRPGFKWLKRLVWAFVALFVLVVAVIALLPSIITPEWIRTEAETRLTDLLGVSVEIGALDYDLFSHLRLDDVRIGPPPGFSEDPLRLSRLEAQYDLSAVLDRKITVRRLHITAPRLVFEEGKQGSNIEAILAGLAGEETPEAPDGEPKGPLLPVDLNLESIEVVDVELVLASEARHMKLEGVSLRASGRADRSRLDVDLALAVGSDDDKKKNLAIDFSKEAIAPHGLDLAAKLGLDAKVAVRSKSSEGLALEKADLGLSLGVEDALLETDAPLPPVAVGTDLELSLTPEEDRVALKRLLISFDHKELVGVDASIDGVIAFIQEVSSPSAGTAIGLGLGWPKKKERGILAAHVGAFEIPLEVVQPFARVFEPDLELSGKIGVSELSFEGGAAELGPDLPKDLDAFVSFSDVHAALPSRGVSIAKLNGRLDLGPEPEGDQTTLPFGVHGALRFEGIEAPSVRLRSAEAKLAVATEKLSYPHLGQAKTKLVLGLGRLDAGPASVARGAIEAELSGVDPLAEDRDVEKPVELKVAVNLASPRLEGTDPISMTRLSVNASTELARLLSAADAEIPIRVDVDARQFAANTLAVKAERARVRLNLTADDPRHGAPIALKGRIKVISGRIDTAKADVASADIGLRVSARGLNLMPIEGEPVVVIPDSLFVRIDGTVPELAVEDKEIGRVSLPVSVKGGVSVWPLGRRVRISELELALGELLKLQAKGEGTFRKVPSLDIEARTLEPIALEKVEPLIPKSLLKQIGHVGGSGKVGLSVGFRGELPDPSTLLRLEEPPFEANAQIKMDSVAVNAPRFGLDLSGLGGHLTAEVSPKNISLGTDLSLARLTRRAGPQTVDVRGATAGLLARLQDKSVRIEGSFLAKQLAVGGPKAGRVSEARGEVDIVHPLFGPLDIRILDLRAPDLGVNLLAKGRLERRRFGALRPVLSVKSKVDLDKVKRLAPGLIDGSGAVAVDVEINSRTDQTIDVSGSAELVGVDVMRDEPRLVIRNATGRVPFEQRVLLPAPKPTKGDLSETAGVFGDLDVRLEELVADIVDRARFVIDRESVLKTPPRTADYEALRPYYKPTGARFTVEKLIFEKQTIRNISMDALFRSGVLRIDRMSVQLYEGDAFGEVALQIAGEDHLRLKLRSTITDINLDVPFAEARGERPAKDPDEKKLYLVSGTVDLEVDLKQRTIDGQLNLTKMGDKLVIRAIDVLDPLQEDEGLQDLRSQLQNWGGFVGQEIAGVTLKGANIWIKQNLLNMELVWSRPLLDAYKVEGVPVLPRLWLWVTQPTLGQFIVGQPAFAPRRQSLSSYLERLDFLNDIVFTKMKLKGRLVVPAQGDGGASETAP